MGMRIQQIRKKSGLSQRQLGEKLGVSASMIGQWENDLRNPKYETLRRIAEALGTTIDYLYDIPSLPLKQEQGSSIRWTSEDQELFAVDDFLEKMGYVFGPENVRDPIDLSKVPLQDLRSGKKYFVSYERIEKLVVSITSFSKYQISELISELEEIPPDE